MKKRSMLQTCSNPNRSTNILLALVFAVLCMLISAQGIAAKLGDAKEKHIISVSNKPLAYVVKAVVGDNFHINIIIPDRSDPHHFQLRPSIVLSVQKSDWLLWLGPKIEPNLASLMVSKDDGHRITLAQQFNLDFLPLRSRSNSNSHSHGHGTNSLKQRGAMDPHVWLSPTRMLVVARGLSARLQKSYPEMKSSLEKNLQAFEHAVQTKLSVEALQLEPQSSAMVYHDAYQYFQQEYGLKNAGFIVTELDEALSLRELLNLKKTSNKYLVDCVLTEPGYNPKLIAKIFGENSYRKEQMDPLGRNIFISPTAYVEYIEQIAKHYKRCE